MVQLITGVAKCPEFVMGLPAGSSLESQNQTSVVEPIADDPARTVDTGGPRNVLGLPSNEKSWRAEHWTPKAPQGTLSTRLRCSRHRGDGNATGYLVTSMGSKYQCGAVWNTIAESRQLSRHARKTALA